MSRRRNALIAAGFAYLQSSLGILISFYLTRFLVRSLGKDLYGMWLASGALLAYAALADLGIFGVVPWLVAEAEGRKDRGAMRAILSNCIILGLAGGALYALLAIALWAGLPRLLHLSATDRGVLRGPLLGLALGTAVLFPLRTFPALRLGLQDYKFMGAVTVAQTVLNGALTVLLIRAGWSLWALAVAAVLPLVVAGTASYVRTHRRDADLLTDWPRPSWFETRPILTSGSGQWLAALGWQLAFASDSVIIAFLGSRESVPAFVITSRLGLTLMQFGWALPDAALIGLAQLNAEGNRDRTAAVVLSLIRLHLLLAGAIACVVLCANDGFVQSWVGPDLFGGTQLNAIFAADVVALTVVHALLTPTAVLGKRVEVGSLTLVNGIAHVALAIALGKLWGLRGVAVATLASALLTTIPAGLHLLASVSALRVRTMLLDGIGRWAVRLSPFAIAALAIGWRVRHVDGLGRHGPLVLGASASAIVSLGYLICMRTLLRDLPLGDRLRRVLGLLRLV